MCPSCSLDAESFSGLDALTQLDLSHNQLTSINSQLFTRLSKILVNSEVNYRYFVLKKLKLWTFCVLQPAGVEAAGEPLELFLPDN